MIMSVSLLIIAVVSYLLGGVNGAIIMSRLVYHEDIRKSGSNNPGFTNFKRVYGLNAAAWSVMLIDILKTALPVFLSAVYMGVMYDDMWQFGAQFAGLFCMLGHCFPVWYGFKGGKAFIAGFATIWFVDWRMTLIAYLGYSNVWVEVLAIAAAALVIIRHYPNFVKLVHGTESKFTLSSKH